MKHDNAEAFVEMFTSIFQKGAGPKLGSLFWANGILFRYVGFNPTDCMNLEYLNRRLPLDFLEFASMPHFKKELRSGEFVITVLDVSNHRMYDILTKWISENLIKSESQIRY